MPQTVELGHTIAHWCTLADDHDANARRLIGPIAMTLVNVRERNDGWVTLAARLFGLLERDLWDNIALGDDRVLLAIMMAVTPLRDEPSK
jgi:hypothetical protein